MPLIAADQTALTVIARVKPGEVRNLRALLAKINGGPSIPSNIGPKYDVETNPIIPFKAFSHVHFTRFVILDDEAGADGQGDGAQLVYSTNFDGSLEMHLDELTNTTVGAAGMCSVFSHCLGFPKAGNAGESVKQFIRANARAVHTFYRGHRGLPVPTIKYEDGVYQAIQRYLAQCPPAGDADPVRLKEKITQHVQTAELGAAPESFRPRSWNPIISTAGWILLYVIAPISVLIAAGHYLLHLSWGLLAGGFAAAAAIAIGYLRLLEHRAPELADDAANVSTAFENAAELTKQEDFIVQNQLTHLVELRPGIFRLALQHVVLSILQWLANYTFNQGKLGDISSIHFARWSVIDGGRRLLFFSNFDGSWENYLGDFVDRAAVGLTLAWSNTIEFPKTKFLAFGGARDEERFKRWARKYQIPTQVWYSAYKDLTVENILRNHAVATGLTTSMDVDETRAWLRLL